MYRSKFGKNFNGPKLLDSEWEKMTKHMEVLELFCRATELFSGEKYVSCSFVLPLLLLLFIKYKAVQDDDSGYKARFMAVQDDDSGYKARFKAATQDFQVCMTGMDGVKLLRIALHGPSL